MRVPNTDAVPVNFNPPSPCGEGPHIVIVIHHRPAFQSTLPMRGGTLLGLLVFGSNAYFNPPSPCGEGRNEINPMITEPSISIHPPHAGRDYLLDRQDQRPNISIHPPHAGRDYSFRLPEETIEISIHPPHAGRDNSFGIIGRTDSNFNPPSPCGEGPAQRRT